MDIQLLEWSGRIQSVLVDGVKSEEEEDVLLEFPKEQY